MMGTLMSYLLQTYKYGKMEHMDRLQTVPYINSYPHASRSITQLLYRRKNSHYPICRTKTIYDSKLKNIIYQREENET